MPADYSLRTLAPAIRKYLTSEMIAQQSDAIGRQRKAISAFGTSNPQAKLDVEGSVRASEGITLRWELRYDLEETFRRVAPAQLAAQQNADEDYGRELL